MGIGQHQRARAAAWTPPRSSTSSCSSRQPRRRGSSRAWPPRSRSSPSSRRSTPRSPPWRRGRPTWPSRAASPPSRPPARTRRSPSPPPARRGPGGFSVRVDQTAASHRLELANAVGLTTAGAVPTVLRLDRLDGSAPVDVTSDGTLAGLVNAINDPASATGLRATAVKVGTDQYRLVVESATTRRRRRLHAHRRRRLRRCWAGRPSAPVATPRSRSATPSSPPRPPTPSPTSCRA